MRLGNLSKLFVSVGAAALLALASPAAAIVLEFTELPNETGIVATETGAVGGPGSLTVAGETISLFDRNQAGALGNFSGLGSPVQIIFNLLEPDGSISDQVIVFPACPGALQPPCNIAVGFGGVRVMFTSDPALFDLGQAFNTIEDGTRQFVGSYVNNAGQTVEIFVTSDVDATVPAPASLALLALGLAGLGFWRRAVKT